MSRQDVKDGAKILGGGFGTILAVILGFMAVGAVIWGISVATSDIRGQGDAQMQINSGTNRIDQYTHFWTLDKDIRSQSQNVATAKQQLDDFNKAMPISKDEPFNISEQRTSLQNNYNGPLQLCRANVAQYNNDSKAYTSAKFKDSQLPWGYDPTACDSPISLPVAPPAP
jgi:hypothetical protein